MLMQFGWVHLRRRVTFKVRIKEADMYLTIIYNISIQTEGSPSKVWIKRHRQTDYPSLTDVLAKVLIFRESHVAPLDLIEK